MTLGDLIKAITTPDHIGGLEPAPFTKKKVLFHTSDRHDLELLSVYYDEKKDVVNIDIGEDGE